MRMGRYCAIKNCENAGRCFRDKMIKVYRFPKDKELEIEWIKRAGDNLKEIKRTSAGICENHFQIDDFDYYDPLTGHPVFVHFEEEVKDQVLEKKLHFYAVPSIFQIGEGGHDVMTIPPANEVDDSDLFSLSRYEDDQAEFVRFRKEKRKKEYSEKLKAKKIIELREEWKILQDIPSASWSTPVPSSSLDLLGGGGGGGDFDGGSSTISTTDLMDLDCFSTVEVYSEETILSPLIHNSNCEDGKSTFDKLRATLSISRKNEV